jgi:hypothetical protein
VIAGSWVVGWKAVGDCLKLESRKACESGKDVGVTDEAIVVVNCVEEGDMDAGKGKKLG